jgi:hypothetical protein
MFDFEADKFEKSEQFDVILKMRKWDEQGKDSEVETPPLQKYKRLYSRNVSCTLMLTSTFVMSCILRYLCSFFVEGSIIGV